MKMLKLNSLTRATIRAYSITKQLPTKPIIKSKCTILSKTEKTPIWPVTSCSPCLADHKTCLNIDSITIETGRPCNTPMIRSFLNDNYWPREPTVLGFMVDLDSPYLEILTEKYTHSGDRFIAFERLYGTEKKTVGLCVGNKVYPGLIDELEEWAHCTSNKADRNRMYFRAHCLKSPRLFEKYDVEYIYDIEILGTSPDIASYDVGVRLLQTAFEQARLAGIPLVTVVSASMYTSRIAEKCGMKLEWQMEYRDFVDRYGQPVFFPRGPLKFVSLYVKYFYTKNCVL